MCVQQQNYGDLRILKNEKKNRGHTISRQLEIDFWQEF